MNFCTARSRLTQKIGKSPNSDKNWREEPSTKGKSLVWSVAITSPWNLVSPSLTAFKIVVLSAFTFRVGSVLLSTLHPAYIFPLSVSTAAPKRRLTRLLLAISQALIAASIISSRKVIPLSPIASRPAYRLSYASCPSAIACWLTFRYSPEAMSTNLKLLSLTKWLLVTMSSTVVDLVMFISSFSFPNGVSAVGSFLIRLASTLFSLSPVWAQSKSKVPSL